MKVALTVAATSVENERIFSYVKKYTNIMPNITATELYKRILI